MIRLKIGIFIITIITSLFLYSCNTKVKDGTKLHDYKGNRYIKDLNAEYNNLRSIVDTSFTDHFPFLLDTTTIHLSNAPLNQDTLYKLVLINKVSESEILEKLTQEGIAVYYGDTPCVFPFQMIESFVKYPSSFRQCIVDKYPIPDFRFLDFFDKSTESFLPPDFKIVVIESMPYIDIPDSLVVSNTLLAEKWEKGFSRGVAISEEKMIIIYWTIIWQ